MIHPSYIELMNAVNRDCDPEDPIVKSRYSIVTATAKRARQLIDHADSAVEDIEDRKPLSIAVEEINDGSVKILSDASAKALREEIERSKLLAEAAKEAEENAEEATEEEGAEAEAEEAVAAEAEEEPESADDQAE